MVGRAPTSVYWTKVGSAGNGGQPGARRQKAGREDGASRRLQLLMRAGGETVPCQSWVSSRFMNSGSASAPRWIPAL